MRGSGVCGLRWGWGGGLIRKKYEARNEEKGKEKVAQWWNLFRKKSCKRRCRGKRESRRILGLIKKFYPCLRLKLKEIKAAFLHFGLGPTHKWAENILLSVDFCSSLSPGGRSECTRQTWQGREGKGGFVDKESACRLVQMSSSSSSFSLTCHREGCSGGDKRGIR